MLIFLFLPPQTAEVARNDTCPELPEISNGWKSASHPELVQGTVVTYQCYPGYQVVGAELLMCQWDLTWSGDLPSCERGEYTQLLPYPLELEKMLKTGLASESVGIRF